MVSSIFNSPLSTSVITKGKAANILVNQASTGIVNFTSSAQIPVSTIQVKSYGENSVSGINFQEGALFASGSDDDLELYFYNGDVIKKVTLT